MAKDKDVNLKVRPLDDRVVVEPLEAAGRLLFETELWFFRGH